MANLKLLIDELLTEQIIPGTNHDIYDERLRNAANFPNHNKTPHSIYFYYVAFGAEGQPDIRRYHYLGQATSISFAQAEAKIKEMAINAKYNRSDPRFILAGRGLDGLKWDRKSYIVFFMDSPHWKLFKRVNGKVAILFKVTQNSTANHSFFDAKDVDIDVSEVVGAPQMRTAIYFVNHMKKNTPGLDLVLDGNNVGEKQDFFFDIFFDVTDQQGNTMPFVLDPGGTNQGPAVGPP